MCLVRIPGLFCFALMATLVGCTEAQLCASSFREERLQMQSFPYLFALKIDAWKRMFFGADWILLS